MPKTSHEPTEKMIGTNQDEEHLPKKRTIDPEVRLARIEKKLGVLTIMALVQTVLLATLLLGKWLPSLLTVIQASIFLALLVAVLYIFREQIPIWIGDASRYFFSLFRADDSKS